VGFSVNLNIHSKLSLSQRSHIELFKLTHFLRCVRQFSPINQISFIELIFSIKKHTWFISLLSSIKYVFHYNKNYKIEETNKLKWWVADAAVLHYGSEH
jgi:hypothetical protein